MKKKKNQFDFQKFLHSKYGNFISIVLSLSIIIGISFIYINHTQEIKAQEVISKVGSRGDEVRRLQNKLKSLGFFNGTVDGIYGTETKEAVLAAQRYFGLPETAVVDATTWEEIYDQFSGIENISLRDPEVFPNQSMTNAPRRQQYSR